MNAILSLDAVTAIAESAERDIVCRCINTDESTRTLTLACGGIEEANGTHIRYYGTDSSGRYWRVHVPI